MHCKAAIRDPPQMLLHDRMFSRVAVLARTPSKSLSSVETRKPGRDPPETDANPTPHLLHVVWYDSMTRLVWSLSYESMMSKHLRF